MTVAYTFPVFKCALALGNNPGDTTLTWTDVSTYLRRFSIQRGRQYELNAYQAGTATITLRNTDRRFDPLYASSPYYPNVKPLVPIRIQATFQSTTYTLFMGYVERWPQQRQGPNYSEIVLDAVDGFELLSQAVLPGASYPLELSGTRIGRVLDAVSWSSTARNIAAGQSDVQAYTFTSLDGVNALEHIQAVEQSELGQFFIIGDGTATFFDRHTPLGSTSQGTFTDKPSVDTGDIGYVDVVATLDKDLITNDFVVSITGSSTEYEAMDSSSITAYFLRTQTRTLLLTSGSEALSNAQLLAIQYANPVLRIASITVTPGNVDGAWTQVLARDLGDRITARANPPGGGAALVQDSFIQQYNLTVDTHAATASQTWGLLPVSIVAQGGLVLNDSVKGTLDTTGNVLGY